MCSQAWVTYLEFTDIIRPLTYLTLSNGESKQIPAATTERYKKPTGSELYGRNLCVVLFFFFFCLERIFVYLRLPGGSSVFSVCSVRVSDSVRGGSEQACE